MQYSAAKEATFLKRSQYLAFASRRCVEDEPCRVELVETDLLSPALSLDWPPLYKGLAPHDQPNRRATEIELTCVALEGEHCDSDSSGGPISGKHTSGELTGSHGHDRTGKTLTISTHTTSGCAAVAVVLLRHRRVCRHYWRACGIIPVRKAPSNQREVRSSGNW